MTWESASSTSYTTNGTLLNDQRTNPFPDVSYPRQPGLNGSVRVNLAQSNDNTPGSPPRYRRGRDADSPAWDDDAAVRLRTTLNPPGDAYDYLSLVRKPLGLRKPNPYKGRLGLRESKQFGVAWLVRDPCGIVCLVFTWLLIFYAEMVVSCIVLPRAPSLVFCWISGPIFHFLSFMAFISHVKAFSTDPGTIPIGNATNDVLAYIQEAYGDSAPTVVRCIKCLCIKPARAHHCSVCYRCVRKMDHHCPWINNCVGEANQKYFVLFTLYICLQSLFALYICIHFAIQCAQSDWEVCELDPDNGSLTSYLALPVGWPGTFAFTMGLMFEAVVFGLFTLIMCSGQLYSIADDETGIESLGRNPPQRDRRSRWKNIVAAFGSPFSWRWFSPFTPPPSVTPIFPNLTDDTCPLLSSTSSLSFTSRNDDDNRPNHQNGRTTSAMIALDLSGTRPLDSSWANEMNPHRDATVPRDILTL